MIKHNSLLPYSLQGLGRLAFSQATLSALLARYFLIPPWRFTSRQIVEGERLRYLAISRSDLLAANPREMSSRSARVSVVGERLGSSGRTPPVLWMIPNIDEWYRSNNLAISCALSPR